MSEQITDAANAAATRPPRTFTPAKTYAPIGSVGGYVMVEHSDGKYVRLSDYDSLRAETAKLQADLAAVVKERDEAEKAWADSVEVIDKLKADFARLTSQHADEVATLTAERDSDRNAFTVGESTTNKLHPSPDLHEALERLLCVFGDASLQPGDNHEHSNVVFAIDSITERAQQLFGDSRRALDLYNTLYELGCRESCMGWVNERAEGFSGKLNVATTAVHEVAKAIHEHGNDRLSYDAIWTAHRAYEAFKNENR